MFSIALKKTMVSALAVGLLMGVAGASQAQVLFNYNSTVTPATITNNGITVTTDVAQTGTGQNAFGTGTAVRAGGFKVTAGPAVAATFAGNFTDVFTITDVASGQSGALNFTVGLGVQANSTQVIPGTTTYNLTPPVQAITLGFNRYFVNLNNFDEVATPNSTNFGSFSFRVQTNAVPEPGSVALLVGMGVSGAGFLVRRRRSK